MIRRLSTVLLVSFMSYGMVLMAIPNQPSTLSEEGVDRPETRVIEKAVDFRLAAKKAIPAVVQISVKGKRGSSIFGDEGSDDYSDLLGNDLWNFFRFPRRRDMRSQPVSGQASGVIVSPDGYILTNSHVVSGMETISVQLNDGREFPAKLLGEDTNMDLALLKINAQNLPYLMLGNSDNLEVGQWVAAIGNPFGLQATFTVGVVSAKSRNNLDLVHYEDFIQTDAPINTGNSGGALVTLDGELIGINTAIATNSSLGYLGISFAIPSNMAQYVMKEIISGGKVGRGYLGINLQAIDYNLARSFDLDKVEGALVTSVEKGSAADQSGLKAEDIILKYDGHPVENAATLRNAVYMMHPRTKVILTVLRQGEIIELPVEIGQYAGKNSHEEVSTTSKHALGLEVDNLTPEIAQTFGYTNDKGVIVTKVQPSTPASLVGIKKGALILAVNRQKIENKNQFYAALNSTASDKPVLLHIKQGDRYFFVSIQID